MGTIRFGAEGWRARVGEGFDDAHVARIARALGETWSWRCQGATVMVGYDTRRDSRRLAELSGEVMAACGLTVIVSDAPCPLPALAWSTAHDAACVGAVMLTASGSSHRHGGILVRQSDGGPVSAAFAEAVERRIVGRATSERGVVRHADLVTDYLEDLVALLGGPVSGSSAPRVVVDPMYGATVGWATQLFERLGCEVESLHDRMVPDFRGLHPNPREPWVDECERAVADRRADLGIVFDGDGDRMGVIDETGRLVSPHDLAPLALQYLVGKGSDQDRVVGTFATSVRLQRQAERLGCAYTAVPVGFDAIYREFGEGDVVLAADERGAIACPDHLCERDGLLSAGLVALALLGGKGSASKKVAKLAKRLGHTEWATRTVPLDPASQQTLRNVLPGMNPSEVAGMRPDRISHAGGLRLVFEGRAWLLLSDSKARTAATVTAEAEDQATLARLLDEGVRLVRTQ